MILQMTEIQNSLQTAKIIKNYILNSTKKLNYRLLFETKVCSRLENFPSDMQVLEGIYNYSKSVFQYIKDIQNAEYVKTDERIYNEIVLDGRTIGDCDDSTVLTGSLIINAGYVPIIRLVAFNNEDYFSHIYCYVKINNDDICMDISNIERYFIYHPLGITNYKDIEVL